MTEAVEVTVESLALESPVLNTDEAAAYMKVSLSTLARMRRDKNGPAYAMFGTRVVYRKVDLDAFIESKIV